MRTVEVTPVLIAGGGPAGLAAARPSSVASAAANLASLATDLPRDVASIQRAKLAEFHSLGLVLGYSYAGAPILQPGGADQGGHDVTSYTPRTDPGGPATPPGLTSTGRSARVRPPR
jgi:hypothetical protein